MNSSLDITEKIKFLYSYGGKIVPRPSDGVLRYIGGFTRVLSVDRSITFLDLMVKFGESCGSSMILTCKLPSEDLDVLISVKSNEDLRNVMEEYDRASLEMKIRAVLFPIKAAKKVSPPPSPMSCFDFPSPPKPCRKRSPSAVTYCNTAPHVAVHRCCSQAIHRRESSTLVYPIPAGHHRRHEGWNPRNVQNISHRNYSHSRYYYEG
ncbi:RAF-like serine/threonine-protein kinase 20 [Primulina tabacum]|uniref:RAF-like serine/threonine-protein kinase 20 n=1 Tax=Primulina tabacum TaxID=48773 RepID=UPI003F5A1CC9